MKKAPPSSGAWCPSGSVLFPPRHGANEALVQRHGVLCGDALDVLALGQPASLPEDDVDEVAEEAPVDPEHLVELERLAL